MEEAAGPPPLPQEAVLASLGCGSPLAVAELWQGERVLDLGSGGGIDVPQQSAFTPTSVTVNAARAWPGTGR